ncbi:MAG: transglycosylase SLT domain-containing protein, partial [Acidobacteria bacterium]|nr:transglycosylase SLT domain-containing protein [Acidobacteriota bacterium]
GTELEGLSDVFDRGSRTVFDLDLGRAQRLFGSRSYAEARAGFEALQAGASGDTRELVDLRLAECDFYLGRYGSTLDGTRPHLDRAARKAEAQFFHLSALRELGEADEYVSRTRALVAEFPDSSWSEEALNNLAIYYTRTDDDAAAAETYGELFRRFPNGPRAERAAWKVGWWAYKNARYDEASAVFEQTAATFPRSDYRPSYLYWSARARDHVGDGAAATARYRLATVDYMKTYYGRLSARRLEHRRVEAGDDGEAIEATNGRQGMPSAPAPASTSDSTIEPGLPPTHALIRLLLSLELYEQAANEVQFAQRVYGDSPALQATLAFVHNRRGDFRRGINLMKRAYPQHMTEAAKLPPDILKVIFPLEYWELIRRHATARGLDPYLIAALVAQESTFDATIRSAANAWGLMQIIPATGRRLARSVGIRRFRTEMLTRPDVNVRLGTTHFKRLVTQFGGAHVALASYNAGESRVARWVAERPGLERDEFIDDIPFPETQNYVKRILGTAEDYRQLYGSETVRPGRALREPPSRPASRRPVAKSPTGEKPQKSGARRK